MSWFKKKSPTSRLDRLRYLFDSGYAQFVGGSAHGRCTKVRFGSPVLSTRRVTAPGSWEPEEYALKTYREDWGSPLERLYCLHGLSEEELTELRDGLRSSEED